MAAEDKFLEQVFNEHLNNLHTSMPCKVLTYYPTERKADIQPLFKRKRGGITKDYPMIRKAPVLRHVVQCPNNSSTCSCRKDLSTGDIVLVTFAERALDFVGNRRHDLTDAVIIGVM